MTPIWTLYPDLGRNVTRMLLTVLGSVAAAFFGYYLCVSLCGTEYPGIHANLRFLVAALSHCIVCFVLAAAVRRDHLSGRDILLSWLLSVGVIYLLVLVLGTWTARFGSCFKEVVYHIPRWLCWLPYGGPIAWQGHNDYLISPFLQSLYVIGPAVIGHAGAVITGLVCLVRGYYKKDRKLTTV